MFPCVAACIIDACSHTAACIIDACGHTWKHTLVLLSIAASSSKNSLGIKLHRMPADMETETMIVMCQLETKTAWLLSHARCGNDANMETETMIVMCQLETKTIWIESHTRCGNDANMETETMIVMSQLETKTLWVSIAY